MRVWREPISLLENAKGKVGPMRPWMQGIRESKYDFSKLQEDAEDYSEVVVAQEQVLSTNFAALSLDNGVPLDSIGRGDTLETDAAPRRVSQTPLMPPMQAPKKMLNVGASEFVPSLGGFAEDGSGTGRMEGDNDLDVDVERNMENDTAGDSLPGDMSDEQWLRTNSHIGAENLTLWYTDQVRKWYRHAV